MWSFVFFPSGFLDSVKVWCLHVQFFRILLTLLFCSCFTPIPWCVYICLDIFLFFFFCVHWIQCRCGHFDMRWSAVHMAKLGLGVGGLWLWLRAPNLEILGKRELHDSSKWTILRSMIQPLKLGKKVLAQKSVCLMVVLTVLCQQFFLWYTLICCKVSFSKVKAIPHSRPSKGNTQTSGNAESLSLVFTH